MFNDDSTQAPDSTASSPFAGYLQAFWQAVGGNPEHLAHLAVTGNGSLPCAFAYTDFAAAAIGAASLAIAELLSVTSGKLPSVTVDRRLASFWFGTSLRPQGWALPSPWDPVAGDYQAADGWIRLHTNAPHHRDAALAVLGVAGERDAVARAVSGWSASALETAIVERNGCVAAMHTLQEWADHPQGQAVRDEPLLHHALSARVARAAWPVSADRPLRGVRVLDLTRVLAGPVATRFLAGFGAEVLRIDPYGWEEPGLVPEVVLGKRCARLDLRNAFDRATFERLLGEADVLVHGYRPDALARLGLGVERRRQLNPALVDVSLDAYGWSGPWCERRGFDSLVQMSSGIADAGMRMARSDRPVPLPGQGIDHGTGYLMAAAVIRGLTERLTTGAGCVARASLARTAQLLIAHAGVQEGGVPMQPEHPDDLAAQIEHTSWGPAQRIKAPASVDGTPMYWDYPAGELGSVDAEWQSTGPR